MYRLLLDAAQRGTASSAQRKSSKRSFEDKKKRCYTDFSYCSNNDRQLKINTM